MKSTANRRMLLIFVPVIALFFLASRAPESETFVLDKKESIVTWKCTMKLVPANAHNGFIEISHGQLMFEKDRLVGGAVEIDMKTITDEAHSSRNDLIDHLKSADFFDVEKFPVSTFEITSIGSGEKKSLNVTGNLTVKGITHAITFPVNVKVTDGVVNADGKVVIDRSKWDVRYGSETFFGNLKGEAISDEIEIEVKLVGRKKEKK